jgi:7-keto-8-aminopelargonate synthetase-like enzyme
MLPELKQELEQIALAGGERQFRECVARRNGVISFRGRSAIDFTNWDRYDLNYHPGLRRSVQQVIEGYGFSTGAARGSTGSAALHSACERRLAEFMGFEGATLFSSKNQAVFSLITAIASERDVVLFDEAMQSPVGDAAYLVNCPTATFPSGNLARARGELEKFKGARRRLLCVESVSPMSGEALDLVGWSALAQKFDAELIVDESYAIGGQGLRGAGGLEALPLKSGVLCAYADCAVSLAGSGSFIAGPLPLIRYLMQRSRTFVVEVAPSPVAMAVVEGALTHIELGHHARERMNLSAGKLREGLIQMGALRAGVVTGAIVGLPFKTHRLAREVGEALFQKGVVVDVLARPTGGSSPSLDGAAFVRFLVSAVHTPRQIEDTLQACSEIWGKIDSQ